MRTSRVLRSLSSALAAVLLSSAVPHAQTPGFGSGLDFGDLGFPWPFSGGDIHNTRSAGFADPELNAQTVAGLTVKWVFTTAGDVAATPTVEGDALYLPDRGGMLWKIDTATGTAIWSHKVSDYTGNPNSYSRTSPAIAGRAIVLGDQGGGANLIAVDKFTGELIWKRVLDPLPSAWIMSAPVVFGGRIYVGVASNEEALAAAVPGFQPSFRGRVVSLDLATGAVRWEFRTMPEGYTGGAVVGGNLVIDEKRLSLYFASGNNYSVPQAASICLFVASTVEEQSACLDPSNYEDSVLAVDLFDGRLKWVFHTLGFDTFTGNCLIGSPLCPKPAGPDFDFASAPNLFTVRHSADPDSDSDNDGREQDILGIGQKSGVYWALNPENGTVIWSTVVGPGGELGGIEWGSAVDGSRVYVALSNNFHRPYNLGGPNGPLTRAGSWAALDAATGAMVWQVLTVGQDPAFPQARSLAIGAVSTANGIAFAGTNSGDMVALDGATGNILWHFASGGTVISGPAIVGDSLYWGSGYTNPNMGHISNNKLYAFTLPNRF